MRYPILLIAACLALVFSAPAGASTLERGECRAVPSHTGPYGDSNCLEPGGKGNHEWRFVPEGAFDGHPWFEEELMVVRYVGTGAVAFEFGGTDTIGGLTSLSTDATSLHMWGGRTARTHGEACGTGPEGEVDTEPWSGAIRLEGGAPVEDVAVPPVSFFCGPTPHTLEGTMTGAFCEREEGCAEPAQLNVTRSKTYLFFGPEYGAQSMTLDGLPVTVSVEREERFSPEPDTKEHVVPPNKHMELRLP